MLPDPQFPMSALNLFVVLREGRADFSMLTVTPAYLSFLTDTYLEETLAGDSVLHSSERFGRVLLPIEQRRLCDRQVSTPRPFRVGFVFGLLCGGSKESSEIVILVQLYGAPQTAS